MRHFPRLDANHNDIVRALRASGCSVQSLASLGGGAPDILVGIDGHNYLFEIKDPTKPPSKRRLTPEEESWHLGWRGQVHIIETLGDALEVLSERDCLCTAHHGPGGALAVCGGEA